MHIPNLLTLLRFILVPIFFYTFYNMSENSYLIPFIVFIIAGITDVLDGYIARKFNMVTKLGMLIDPLADKIMQLSVLFALSHKQIIPKWIVIVIFIKESFLIIGSGFLYKKNYVTKSNLFGKISTVLFYIAVLVVVFVNKIIGTYILILTVIVTVLAAVNYTFEYVNRKDMEK